MECHPRIVFMKFHKVASASIRSTLEQGLDHHQLWWNNNCTGVPFEHAVLRLYEQVPVSDIHRKCIIPTSNGCNASFVAVLRNPIERTISQLFAFNKDLLKALYLIQTSHPSHNSSNLQHAIDTANKMHTQSINLTVDDMSNLIEIMDLHRHNHMDLVGNLNIYEYTQIFSRSKSSIPYKSTLSLAQKAVQNMKSDLGVVGLTEWLDSFYTLLGLKFGFHPPRRCSAHNDHGMSTQYKILFGQSHRPPPDKIFTSEVVAFLETKLLYEMHVWREAKLMHEQQLADYNMTLELSQEKYRLDCMHHK